MSQGYRYWFASVMQWIESSGQFRELESNIKLVSSNHKLWSKGVEFDNDICKKSLLSQFGFEHGSHIMDRNSEVYGSL